MPRRALVLINPAAATGTARGARDRIECELRRLGVQARLAESAAPGHLVELARSAAESRDYDIIAAAGGDGTVREVATGLLASSAPQTPLAVLPLGTGNDFAHVAGTPDLPSGFHAIAHGRTQPTDAIEVTCRIDGRPIVTHALSFAAVGLAADVVRLTTPSVRRWFGPKLCYSVGFFRALVRYQPVRATVRCDQREFHDDYLLVCAGNTSHAGGQTMHLSPGADCRDGTLNVSLIKAATRFDVARRFVSLRRGTHVHHPKAAYFPGRSIEVTTATPADVQLDGDNVGTTPARFRVLPAALQLVTGPASI